MNTKLRFKELTIFFLFLRKYWIYEAFMLLLILIGTSCSLAAPFVLGKIIDVVIPQSDRKLLLVLTFIMIGINLVRFFVGIFSDYLNTWLSGLIIRDIKESLFSIILRMPYSFFEKNKPGEVIQVISSEVEKIQRFLTTGLIRLINNVFTLLCLGAVMCFLNYKLFAITLVIIPVVIIINAWIGKRVRQMVKHTGEKEGELYNFYFERIKNVILIKLFNSFDYEQSKLSRNTSRIFELNLLNTKLTTLGSNGSSFFISLSPLIILLAGGNQVMNQVMSIGALVAFIQYCNRLIPPANDFLNLYIDYVKAHESAKRIYPYLELRNKSPKIEYALKNSPVTKINCNNLGFSIDHTTILSNINIEFVKGCSYGIVGSNGAGKSTLIKLISKLYAATNGSIVINGSHKIENISQEEWTGFTTVITQQAHIFHESIRENLLYANRDLTEADLWSALEIVNLRTYVESLPHQLDTLIGDGEESANPSGGQIQKLSLARALLKKADVILLDEVTSAMDSSSAKEVLDLILKSFSDKIVICITHSLSDAMLFNKVVVLASGRIVEFGDPQNLLSSDNKYNDLFKYQITKTSI